MADLSLVQGTTSKLVMIDAANAAGGLLTGLAFNTLGLVCYYLIEGAAAPVQITLATMTLGTWTSGGFVAAGSNMPGTYQLGVPNAALTGGKWVKIMLSGATGLNPSDVLLELTAINNQDAVRAGLTALPNANAAASGGLATVDANNSVKIQTVFKKNIANSNFQFLMVDGTGAPATGLTVTATRAIDNGSFGACANSVTEIANGWYIINLANSDLNGSNIAFRFTASGAAPLNFSVQPNP